MTLIRRRQLRRADRRGFTLVEVLAAMLLIAIVLPAVMQGITAARSAGGAAQRRSEAASLASSKLAEIVVTGDWQGGNLSGDFSPDRPDYHWQATVGNWNGDTADTGLQQIDLRVTWVARNREDSVTLSTLAYVRGQQ